MVGDIVLVANGMEVPSDGILIIGAEITADESAMTGETMPIRKETLIKCVSQRNTIVQEGGKNSAGAHDVASPVLLSGSRILSGEGKMVVIAVGNLSAIGKIQHLLESGEE